MKRKLCARLIVSGLIFYAMLWWATAACAASNPIHVEWNIEERERKSNSFSAHMRIINDFHDTLVEQLYIELHFFDEDGVDLVEKYTSLNADFFFRIMPQNLQNTKDIIGDFRAVGKEVFIEMLPPSSSLEISWGITPDYARFYENSEGKAYNVGAVAVYALREQVHFVDVPATRIWVRPGFKDMQKYAVAFEQRYDNPTNFSWGRPDFKDMREYAVSFEYPPETGDILVVQSPKKLFQIVFVKNIVTLEPLTLFQSQGASKGVYVIEHGLYDGVVVEGRNEVTIFYSLFPNLYGSFEQAKAGALSLKMETVPSVRCQPLKQFLESYEIVHKRKPTGINNAP